MDNAGDRVIDSRDIAIARLLTVTEESFAQRSHLRHALESRIVIEQAKGVLAERLRLTPDQAFEILRRAARTHRMRVRDLAEGVLESPQTPKEVLSVLNGRRRSASV
jgi:AmiR/NasT family two-component response regulator